MIVPKQRNSRRHVELLSKIKHIFLFLCKPCTASSPQEGLNSGHFTWNNSNCNNSWWERLRLCHVACNVTKPVLDCLDTPSSDSLTITITMSPNSYLAQISARSNPLSYRITPWPTPSFHGISYLMFTTRSAASTAISDNESFLQFMTNGSYTGIPVESHRVFLFF